MQLILILGQKPVWIKGL